ncbi:diaminopimelate epimerase [Labrys okinawensis]|uniref:Diaminopimelate epimerase n=1 Tax=Labrys okinawensis TaxID=346911 RepID=A0A2S9QGX4_9HYPH|nr:diaminopimelate epimerase [Labrys okinawensis]PRH88607.1 diaminopimelate epimerase [Labrys okinawensis]
MSGLANRPYLKMNGIGNEIVVLDLTDGSHAVTPAEARAIAAHEPFDQLMVLYPPQQAGTDAFMRIFNSDGSQSGACGNGTRCVSWYLMPVLGKDQLMLQTPTSLVEARRAGADFAADNFTVDMGPPALDWQAIPLARDAGDTRAIDYAYGAAEAPLLQSPSVVSMGNPHAVFWIDRDPAEIDLAAIGPAIEHDPLFPERVNVSIAQVRDNSQIVLRVWERGAGLTRACGSAACATGVAAARLGLTGRKTRISLPGGDLRIEWREADGHVLMTGAAALEHEGRFAASWFADAA